MGPKVMLAAVTWSLEDEKHVKAQERWSGFSYSPKAGAEHAWR